jgi:hypothetical protein
MIPRTFPSQVNSTTGRVEMKVSFINDPSGLTRWIDYIPVSYVTDSTPKEGSYDNDGYIAVVDVGSTSGLQAGKDYVRVVLEQGSTDAWQVSSVGFIPVGYSGFGSIPTLFANSEPGVWYDPSDMSTLFQDSAGTTPVTAVEQPVGLMLDKSGNNLHATQSTSTSRPVLSARYNLLERTEDFANAYWTKAAVTAASALITDTAVFGAHTVFRSISVTGANTLYVEAKEGTIRYLVLYMFASGTVKGVIFDLRTGLFVSHCDNANQVSSYLSELSSDGFCKLSITANLSTSQVGFSLSNSATPMLTPTRIPTYSGTGSGTIELRNASLVPANQASLPYQRVDTSTVYDSDATKFPPYLKFDGVDDWMVTPTITPGTDKVQVFAGVRKLSDAATGMVAELSASINTNNGSIYVLAPASAAPNFGWASKGTAPIGIASPNTFTAPITNVLTGIGDISGDVAILRINGTQAASSAGDQGTGNYLAYPLYIGRRGGTALPFNGQLYSLITRFGPNLPTATIEAAEKYVAVKTGITL